MSSGLKGYLPVNFNLMVKIFSTSGFLLKIKVVKDIEGDVCTESPSLIFLI
jgi:hypothetical protein